MISVRTTFDRLLQTYNILQLFFGNCDTPHNAQVDVWIQLNYASDQNSKISIFVSKKSRCVRSDDDAKRSTGRCNGLIVFKARGGIGKRYWM